MKLNAATEMLPLSWIEFNGIHPYVPKNQAMGYHEMMEEMRRDLSEITGFADISFQPNSGAAGEYAGLLVIRDYHKSRGRGAPQCSAHSFVRSRDQSGQCGHGRKQSGRGWLRRQRKHQRG